MEPTLVAVVVVALFFDFTNGFHDTANAIATSVSTRAVSPRVAVLGAAILNFAGAFVSFGILGAGLLMLAIFWIIRAQAPGVVNRVFRRLQIVSAGFVAFTHGTNDAQKTMGIIALALVASGHLSADEFDVPLWVIVSAATAMALGTYAGGWRIIRTLGQRVAKLEPPQGFAAETATASILWFTGTIGFPVSTTQTTPGPCSGPGRIGGVSP